GIVIVAFMRRGGHLYMRPDGVAMRQSGSEVFCPWALFDVTGEPFPLNRRGTILPIASRAVPFISVGKAGGPLGPRQRIKTPALVVQSSHQALLKDCFVVNGKELGALLLFLGRALGAKSLATADADWSLTESPQAEAQEPVPEALVTHNKNGSLTLP